MDKVLEGLYRTKAQLERGWCKYASRRGMWCGGYELRDTVCIIGAVSGSVRSLVEKEDFVERSKLSRVISEYLIKELPERYGRSLASLNDQAATTHADVLNLVQRAIEQRELECEIAEALSEAATQTTETRVPVVVG